MRVVVPVMEFGSSAHLALTAEGVEHTERLCVDDSDYSALLTEYWQGGGFIVVEHDVAPWFGAVQQLAECERDWCMFHYPKCGGMLTRGLGCTKFSERLTREYPDLHEAWRDTDWRILDGTIGMAVAETLKAEVDRHPLCYHGPPLAHVRRLED